MNDHITSISNSIAYKGLIKHGAEEVQQQVFDFNNDQDGNQLPWLKEVKVPSRKVIFINTDNLLNKTL